MKQTKISKRRRTARRDRYKSKAMCGNTANVYWTAEDFIMHHKHGTIQLYSQLRAYMHTLFQSDWALDFERIRADKKHMRTNHRWCVTRKWNIEEKKNRRPSNALTAKWVSESKHERLTKARSEKKKIKNHYSLKTNLPPKKATVKLIRRMFG